MNSPSPLSRKRPAPDSTHEAKEPVTRRECPYLGTINRHMLEFDFEKLCSLSMSNMNVYGCLVCGKYFQGRGKSTHAFTHSLEEKHNVFINLHNTKVYCLPDNYEVTDASLNDIKHYLDPRFTAEEARAIGTKVIYGKALDGTDFIPGTIGINNLKGTDFLSVAVQLTLLIAPLRTQLLLLKFDNIQRPDPVLKSFSDLARKIHNVKNFKGIVSPHEFLQAASVASKKRFRIGDQQDPLAFLAWLIKRLHDKTKRPNGSSVIHDCIQGELLVKTSEASKQHLPPVETKQKFNFLTLDVPPAPVFRDSLDRNMIPQVPVFELLGKFDGERIQEPLPNVLRRFSFSSLPPYLIVHIKRFSKNNFFVEKNPTIVTFPIKNLEFREYFGPDVDPRTVPVSRYDVLASVCHEGKPQTGSYKIIVYNHAHSQWFQIEDLIVTQALPQSVALSEAYIQLLIRHDVRCDGSLDEELRREALRKLAEDAEVSMGPDGMGATDDLDMFAD
eukprot:GHVR01024126.1.p1 GENE.GHVR01024126.1~~GHVR01024126.1.p1  ORF type:complete len:500 (-),score=82.02 GHVR01024126.1:36-1535(-)